MPVERKTAIQTIVKSSVESFAEGFQVRHESEVDDPEGVINMKIHNVFIEALGPEIQFYTALVRSLDSSLGNMLEKMAINIAELSFEVNTRVAGPLSQDQVTEIAHLLESYKRRSRRPHVSDYQGLRSMRPEGEAPTKRHESDYYLIDHDTGTHYLIELKIGGDLDNKKARSEKEAILEQYAILSNTLPPEHEIKIYFATAYNRYGENKEWAQGRVRQFFAPEELLVGKDFWNFVCRLDDGYDVVLGAYRDAAHVLKESLESIRNTYL